MSVPRPTYGLHVTRTKAKREALRSAEPARGGRAFWDSRRHAPV